MTTRCISAPRAEPEAGRIIAAKLDYPMENIASLRAQILMYIDVVQPAQDRKVSKRR